MSKRNKQLIANLFVVALALAIAIVGLLDDEASTMRRLGYVFGVALLVGGAGWNLFSWVRDRRSRD